MNSKAQTVASSDELIAAMRNNELSQITVRGILTNVPSIRLAPGQVLLGEDQAEIHFAAGIDGLQLTSNNQVRSIYLQASSDGCGLLIIAR